MAFSAALLSIGDELLAGSHPDLNAPFVAKQLADLGVTTSEVHVLRDDETLLAERMTELAARHDLVITSGGLGPTLDDVTRHAAARAAGVELEVSAEGLELVRAWFAQRGREMSPSNERQALIPSGSTLVPNEHGTAPGFRVSLCGAWLVCLPGPPRELQAVFAEQVVPQLRALGLLGPARREHSFHMCGIGESDFADRVGDWMDRDAVPTMGVTAKGGILSVHMRLPPDLRAHSQSEAESLMQARIEAFRERLGADVFSEDQPLLERVVGQALIDAGKTLSFAESCTAGLASARLARTPGVSAVLGECFVTYSDRAKRERLGVPEELLAAHGAVSEPVAAAMAEGAARVSGADLAVSISGIAGPGGGSAEKPVGMVCFGVFARTASPPTRALTRVFPAVGREAVRGFAATLALDLARRALAEIR